MAHHEIHDGLLIDIRIEYLIVWAFRGGATSEEYDRVFNEVLREFINASLPYVKASEYLKVDADPIHALDLMQTLSLDFRVTHRNSADWPLGGFEVMPDAQIAVSASYGDEEWTHFSPGYTFSQAAVNCVVEYIRDISIDQLNQHELTFH